MGVRQCLGPKDLPRSYSIIKMSVEDATLTTKEVTKICLPGRQRASDLTLTLYLNSALCIIIINAIH